MPHNVPPSAAPVHAQRLSSLWRGSDITPLGVILSHAVDDAEACRYFLAHGRLHRAPHNETDAQELAFLAAFAPMLRRFPGDRVALWRAHPPEWRRPILDALAHHDTRYRSRSAFTLLVTDWAHYGSAAWTPPRAERIAPPLPWGALGRWVREAQGVPRELWDRDDPIYRLARIEQLARRNARQGAREAVLACWDHYERNLAWSLTLQGASA